MSAADSLVFTPASSTSQGILPSVITTPSGLSLLQLRWEGILAVRTPAQLHCHWDSWASACPPLSLSPSLQDLPCALSAGPSLAPAASLTLWTPPAAVGSLWSLVQRGWGGCQPVLAVLRDLVTLGQTSWNCLVGLNLRRKQMLQREGEASF